MILESLHLILAVATHFVVSFNDNIDELHLFISKVLVTPLFKTTPIGDLRSILAQLDNLSLIWYTTLQISHIHVDHHTGLLQSLLVELPFEFFSYFLVLFHWHLLITAFKPFVVRREEAFIKV